jgi:hypothetical protein
LENTIISRLKVKKTRITDLSYKDDPINLYYNTSIAFTKFYKAFFLPEYIFSTYSFSSKIAKKVLKKENSPIFITRTIRTFIFKVNNVDWPKICKST